MSGINDTTPESEDMSSQSTSDLFTGPERDRLVAQIVEEIRKDSVKFEVLARLKRVNWLDTTSRFFQHPAVLLVIGFVITGYIGGLIANRWQRQDLERQAVRQREEWDRQQVRLIEIHNIDLKYQIMSDITKAIGERNGAATAILEALTEEVRKPQQRDELIKNWENVNKEWRAISQVLRLRIGAYVETAAAANMFSEILDDERKIFASVTLLKNDLGGDQRTDVDDEINEVNNTIKTTTDHMKQLVDIIAEEARRDAKK